jgi:lipid-binding SYLF domain-containing protein
MKYFAHCTFQAGGELADFIIVLRNTDAIKTFSGNAHLSLGAGIGASAGHLGRVAEADFRAGDGGYAACYTYSCSKGMVKIIRIFFNFICQNLCTEIFF